MPLTVREKDHWKERITRKIDQAIEALYASDKPSFLKGIRKEARDQALKSLGIAELSAKVRRIGEQRDQLDAERSRAYQEMLAVVQGKPIDQVRTTHHCEPFEIGAAVSRRAKVHEREVLEKTDVGRRILKLEQEKEELLDTVWLATSTVQIKQLWQTVADVLKQEPTELQHQALRIETIRNGNK